MRPHTLITGTGLAVLELQNGRVLYMNEKVLELASHMLRKKSKELKALRIENRFFKEWDFWAIQSDKGEVLPTVIASGRYNTFILKDEDDFSNIVSMEPVKITSLESALEYVRFYLHLTSPFTRIVNSLLKRSFLSKSERKMWENEMKPPAVTLNKNRTRIIAYLWNYRGYPYCKAVFSIMHDGFIRTDIEKF
jgi:hypothetical protein